VYTQVVLLFAQFPQVGCTCPESAASHGGSGGGVGYLITFDSSRAAGLTTVGWSESPNSKG
jgi:hypothetical protein